MLNKTTSTYFLKYGKISVSFKKNPSLLQSKITCTEKTFDHFSSYSNPCYIEVHPDSMAAIAILSDQDEIEVFIIHKTIKIKKNVPFTIFPLGKSTSYILYTPLNTQRLSHPLKEPFVYTPIMSNVVVPEIFAYYYTIKSLGYFFPGESHSHFELTFVDNGTLETTVENQTFTLNSYDLIFYASGQVHSQKVISDKPCSYLTVIFDLHCPGVKNLLDQVFSCSKEEYQVLTKFIQASSSNDPYAKELMINYLQELILLLLQEHQTKNKAVNPIRQHFENEMLEEILSYIHQKLYQPLSVEEICHHFSISRSSLQHLFKSNLKTTPKKYICNLKLEQSKFLIKEEKYTLSEIALMLGFSSIHYFSRKFTQAFSINPSDFAKKVYDTSKK